MDNKTVEDRTIFLVVVGSNCYGTNLDGVSDFDYCGVMIPTREVILGSERFEQANNFTDENGNKVDKTIYSLNKIVDLMLDNNPNCLDLLGVPDSMIKILKPEYERILEVKNEFISKKTRFTYLSYSLSQIERIKTHRAYLLNPPKKEPLREDYGLSDKSLFPETQVGVISKLSTDYVPEENRDAFHREIMNIINNECIVIFRKYMDQTLISHVLEEFKQSTKEFLHMMSSISGMFLKNEYLEQAHKELAYLAARENWRRYQEWKKNRNPKRKELEDKFGVDLKHLMHSLRLARMSVEILEGKGILVDRRGIDADELVGIRLGQRTYESVLEEVQGLEEKAKVLYETSTLPNRPNRKLINDIKMSIIEKYVFSK